VYFRGRNEGSGPAPAFDEALSFQSRQRMPRSHETYSMDSRQLAFGIHRIPGFQVATFNAP
jgi:hypothetical protein